jgi:hypothetical protein
MPWYYAGPEAKPVGPLSLEELRARREQGIVLGETFVIEHMGQPVEAMAWRRYQDVFSAAAPLPPLPPLSGMPPVPPVPQPAAGIPPHPLFPSGTPSQVPYSPARPGAPLDSYGHAPTNGFCAWGFGIALVSVFLCGFGLIPPLISLVLCCIGLIQVSQHRGERGKGLAIAGVILSLIAILISLAFIAMVAVPMIKAHEIPATEQTSNDSE